MYVFIKCVEIYLVDPICVCAYMPAHVCVSAHILYTSHKQKMAAIIKTSFKLSQTLDPILEECICIH